MVLTIDYREDGVEQWELTPDGVDRALDRSFTPTIYVGDAVSDLYGRRGGPAPEPPEYDGDLPSALRDLRGFLDGQQAIAGLDTVRWRQTWRTDPRPLLRIDVADVDVVPRVARRVQQFGDATAYTCYDVDLTRQFRYSLETGTPAAPDRDVRDLRTLRLTVPRHESGTEALPRLTVGGERVGATPERVAATVADRIARTDPDVLVVNTADIVPLLFEAADARGMGDYALGRRPGFTKLAGESTYESYGRVGHSPARYAVPGRVIVDESNSFFFHESGLSGCLDLVERSGLPLQELGWASIGRVLTAMQIREARSRGVLVPWKAWRPELFKPASVLDDADRGGTTFAPEPGIHETVHELDFSSLYPNVIRTRNVSPETVCCGCCETEDVPGLGYSICEREGYLGDVLGTLIDARDDIKADIPNAESDAERERLEAASSAIKWILVSCFGYQGFSNAKFGRIECHEAINAFAREILLDAKATLEDAGWHVVHGIVDSIWVTPAADREQRPLERVAAEITGNVGIRLEHEATFDWVAFCPRRDSEAGALTRYFGRRAGEKLPDDGGLGDAIKTRGIEIRQRSTPPWIADVQREALRVFDATRDPRAVCDRVGRSLSRLHDGDVTPSELVVDNRVSKDVDQYTHETLTVAALERANRQGSGLAPGQSVRYVVADADRRGSERVRLAYEDPDRYDPDWYADEVVRATESVLAPAGWRETDVREYLSESHDSRLTSYW